MPARNPFELTALILLPLAWIAAPTPAAQTKPSATSQKKQQPTTAKKRTAAARKAPAKKGSTTASVNPAQKTWRTRQLQPTEQRYREIQEALASKGYLHGAPTGAWNQESIDAMRRFQVDQKLASTGKIDSLSLIALGLGPKHETAKATPAN